MKKIYLELPIVKVDPANNWQSKDYAAEHIMMDALMALNKKCRDVAFECGKQIEAMLKED